MSFIGGLLDSITPGVGTALGGLVSGVGSLLGQNSANQMNMQIANNANAFNEQMSNTSWQRGVADMQAAGINPMAAFSQGGASTPSATTIAMQNPMGNSAQSFSSAIQGLTSAQSNPSEIARNIASAGQSQALTAQANEATRKIGHEIANIDSDTDKVKQLIVNLAQEKDNMMNKNLGQSIANAQMEQITKNLITEGQLKLEDLSAVIKTGNLGNLSGQFKPIVDTITNVIRTMSR